jgi:radical SAM superfamily enzyme YgiQ (UPF0313 family)
MTEANISTVFLGIESPDEDVLALNRKFQNIHNPLLESVRAINANGLSVVGSFVIGFDNEKPGAGRRICSFVDEAAIPMVALNLLQVLPNTALWERLKKEGRLLEDRTSGQTTGSVMNFVPVRPQAEIVAEFLEAWDELYDTSRYLERTYRFFLNMRPTRAAIAGSKGRPTTREISKHGPPNRKKWADLWLFLRFSWAHGVRSRYRSQYWRQLVGMLRLNPSRVVRYLNDCGLGENMMHLGNIIRSRVNPVVKESPAKK